MTFSSTVSRLGCALGLTLALTLLAGGCSSDSDESAIADTGVAPDSTSTADAASETPAHIAMPLSSLQFGPLNEGIEIAVLAGNPFEGPASFMLRFAPNNPGVMHTHKHGYQAVVVDGATKHWTLDGTAADAPLQTVGDFWSQGGGGIHQDSNPTDEPATLFIVMDGPLDLEPHMDGAMDDPTGAHLARPLASLDFQPLSDGIEIAVVKGNPFEGPASFMLRFAPNHPGVMHTHTADYQAVVVSGATKHWTLGESEVDAPKQTVGDYWFQAGGAAHQDANPFDVPAVLFIVMDGALDLTPHEE